MKKTLSTSLPVRSHLSEPDSAKKIHSRDSVMGLFLLKNGSISLTGGRIKKLNNNPPPVSISSLVRSHLSEPGSVKIIHSRDSVMGLFFAKT